MSCAAPVNDSEGATAKDWKKGLPIRVVRSYKGYLKHSKNSKDLKDSKNSKNSKSYAPPYGIRYDGIYKVVSYEYITGEKGKMVWRFNFQRDDPS